MLPITCSFRSPRSHRGVIDRAAIGLLASAIVLVGLIAWLSHGRGPPASVVVYCAAGLREPVEAIRNAYESERGISVVVQYGGSNTLLANLKVSQDADLFLPADDSYIALAQQDRLLADTFPVARMRPLLAMKKGNPLQVKSLSDLLTKDVRLSMTDPDAAATGKLVQAALQSAGKWELLKSRVTVFKGTVSEVAADLQVGAADAGIVWDTMLKQLRDFEEVPLPELAGTSALVVAGVVADSRQPAAARALAEYIAAADKGQRFLRDAGFAPASPAEHAP